ncbi:hypothetical protein GCM10009760_22020 [Kitasatospora kazusensis]|uniref:LamG-like jellyroll fold domain-containing protein n=1 Tax=Kitasatospora kazusensis TaxID=407974 RepID=A0ABN2ZB36_9ACTN
MESAGGSMYGGQNGSGGWGAAGYQPGTGGGGPDWAAMAEANERQVRRKRLLRVGIGAAGVLALAGVVGIAVALQGSGGGKPSAGGLPVASAPAGTKAGPSSAAPSTGAPEGGKGLRLGVSAEVGAVDGHSGPALTLHGVHDGYAEVKSGVIDTAKSFTVSAVVSNSAAAQPKAAVSQGSDGFFSLYLGREDSSSADHDRWVFKVQTAAQTGKSVMALSAGPAAAGRWTTLTGVYDAKAKAITLYVDGAPAQTVPVPGILVTNGPIEIGRARYKAHWADFWEGSIADVQVWDQPLSPDRVAQVAKTGSADVPAHATWLRF